MITKVYSAEGLIEAWYEHDRKTLVIRLLHFDIGKHRELSLEKYVSAIEKYQARSVIIDSGDAKGMYQPKDVVFFKTNTFPRIKKTHIRTFICVFPKNPIAGIAAKSWLDIGEQFGFNSIKVPDIEKAYAHTS
jgi:hypothetical protein